MLLFISNTYHCKSGCKETKCIDNVLGNGSTSNAADVFTNVLPVVFVLDTFLLSLMFSDVFNVQEYFGKKNYFNSSICIMRNEHHIVCRYLRAYVRLNIIT